MSSSSPRPVRQLDLRELINRGGQPLPVIVRAVGQLAAGESLLLITPFLPSPLIEKLQSEGLTARPEPIGDGAWQTHVTRP